MNYTTCQDERFTRKLVGLENFGDKVLGHQHVMDHLTRLISGSVFLRAFEKGKSEALIEGKFRAPAEIYIKKEWIHEFTALEDDTNAVCIFDNQEVSAPTF